MENKQIGCINRDENAVNNMIKIVNHYLNKKERLLRAFIIHKKKNKLIIMFME